MKNLLITIITILVFPLTLIAQLDMPPNGFNPRATISEEIGITGITIKYSRPGVKGREGKIWGDVVAYGFGSYSFIRGDLSSPWRAGANETTVISFEHDVKVEGHDIKAGDYALFVALGIDEATIIFSKQTGYWGSFNYEESDDVLRITVKPVKLSNSVEWLKYEFIDHRKDGCTIALQWENLSIPFNISVDVETIVLASVRKQIKGVSGFISANKIQASMYYLEQNTNLEEALSWAKQAVSGKPFGQNPFVAYENLVNIYEKMGRTSEADATLLKGLQIAEKRHFRRFNKKLIDLERAETAVKIMHLAEQRFGSDFMVNNGLGLAYSAMEDFKEAGEYTSKAVRQAPNKEIKEQLKKDLVNLKKGKAIH